MKVPSGEFVLARGPRASATLSGKSWTPLLARCCVSLNPLAMCQENPAKALVSLAQGDPTCYPHLRPSAEMVAALSHAAAVLDLERS